MTPKRLSNLLIVMGGALLSVGCGLAYLPAGLAVSGVCLITAGLLFVDIGE